MKPYRDSPPNPFQDDLSRLLDEQEATYRRGAGFPVLIRIAFLLAAALLIVYGWSRMFGVTVV